MTDAALDEAFEVLSNDRRRQVVDVFASVDDPLYPEHIYTRLAQIRYDVEPGDATDDQIHRERAAFIQYHRDRLLDAGVLQVARDGRYTSYEPGPRFDAYRDVISFADGRL